MSSARRMVEKGCLFKADAKGEEDHVVIGGYQFGEDLKQVRWFSIRIEKSQAPWLFARGHASRTISASELLASLACLVLFVPEVPEETTAGAVSITSVSGITDNQGNTYIVARGSTTKFPVAYGAGQTVEHEAVVAQA